MLVVMEFEKFKRASSLIGFHAGYLEN